MKFTRGRNLPGVPPCGGRPEPARPVKPRPPVTESRAKTDKCRPRKLPGVQLPDSVPRREGDPLPSRAAAAATTPGDRCLSKDLGFPAEERRRGEPRRSYLPEEIPCGDSSAREPAASSSVRCREGPPFLRTPGTNPESAKIASRPLPLPLLRSLSFLLLPLLFF